jgi:hypothetical protein
MGVFLWFFNFLLSDYYVSLLLSTIMILIGFSKPGAKHPVAPTAIGAFRAPVFYRLSGKIQATRCAGDC